LILCCTQVASLTVFLIVIVLFALAESRERVPVEPVLLGGRANPGDGCSCFVKVCLDRSASLVNVCLDHSASLINVCLDHSASLVDVCLDHNASLINVCLQLNTTLVDCCGSIFDDVLHSCDANLTHLCELAGNALDISKSINKFTRLFATHLHFLLASLATECQSEFPVLVEDVHGGLVADIDNLLASLNYDLIKHFLPSCFICLLAAGLLELSDELLLLHDGEQFGEVARIVNHPVEHKFLQIRAIITIVLIDVADKVIITLAIELGDVLDGVETLLTVAQFENCCNH